MNKQQLYPLVFQPILKEKIWGGQKIGTILKKDIGDMLDCGETWEVSGVEGNISVVANGELAGNDLKSLIQQYQGDLVGESIFFHYGDEFPLLVKFIDANRNLSIQVHPDDALAQERHKCKGKTEVWYVVEAEKDAKLISGFNQPMDEQKYLQYVENKSIIDILNIEKVQPGDVYFMPTGRVHAIGSGVMLLEIQQTSDITYRIYDYDREDAHGNKRELHTEQALAAIDYKHYSAYKTQYETTGGQPTKLAECPYFTVNLLPITQQYRFDNTQRESFTILSVVEGEGILKADDFHRNIQLGDNIVIPASLASFEIEPTTSNLKVIESFIPSV